MAPILRFVTSLRSKKKKPKYACLRETRALHSHRTWTEVSSSVHQLKFAVSSGSENGTQICMSKKKKKKLKVSMFPQQGLYGERCSVPRPNVRSFICQSPRKGALPRNAGGNVQSQSTEPHPDGSPTYNGVRPGSPRGSLRTLLSLPQCYAAFSTIPSTLAWADQSLYLCVLL
jgi:hypothetical protein